MQQMAGTKASAGRVLWRISVQVRGEAEEAVKELLQLHFGQSVSSYTDAKTGRTIVSAYLNQRPAGSLKHWESFIKTGLERIAQCGLNVAGGKISLARMAPQDWAESWKRHFKPIAIGSKFLLRPSWSRRRSRPGQVVIELDPGLSFGTGHHPTTAFCLRHLAARRAAGKEQSLLDVGTGSGVLAIAAAKLGYGPVLGLDSDPVAVKIARANARRNGVSSRILFQQFDVAKLPPKPKKLWSVVCANLTTDLLLAARKKLVAQMQTDGVLILAGILQREFPEIERSFRREGLRFLASRREKEWRSGVFGLPIRGPG